MMDLWSNLERERKMIGNNARYKLRDSDFTLLFSNYTSSLFLLGWVYPNILLCSKKKLGKRTYLGKLTLKKINKKKECNWRTREYKNR